MLKFRFVITTGDHRLETMFVNIFSAKILAIPRQIKRLLIVGLDVCLCFIASWISLSLTLGYSVDSDNHVYLLTLISILTAIPTFFACGVYRSIFRFSGWHAIKNATMAFGLYTIMYSSIILSGLFEELPLIMAALQPLTLVAVFITARIAAYALLLQVHHRTEEPSCETNVVIYGAGVAGRQVVNILTTTKTMCVVGFIDDDRHKQNLAINGIPVYSPDDLPNLKQCKRIKNILLAMPSVGRLRKEAILKNLSQLGIAIRTVPSMADLARGRFAVSDLKDLEIENLLWRDRVLPDSELLARKVTGKTVAVTGAGGSIGSELCRQILALKPASLIMIEASEFALHAIYEELIAMQNSQKDCDTIEMIPLICSVQDRNGVRRILEQRKIETIYHAAAYKHVPMVESNPIEGLKNNVFGTLVVAEAAIEFSVTDCVLISTDKAVRPTNVMGASKRLAELIFQALAKPDDRITCLSVVRFGNVLDSSGSVIPKFRKQIAEGGPLTVTHPEATRFFMTIPEAAELVIQASSLANKGDIFILDMGEPIKIVDLAKRMIILSGFTVRDERNHNGDISIEIIGLRPGEKLHEELLIGDTAESSSHDKIIKANERHLSWTDLQPHIETLKLATDHGDVDLCFKILAKAVEGYELNLSNKPSATKTEHRTCNFPD